MNSTDFRSVALVASNKIESGELDDKFRFLDKRLKDKNAGSGNHLIIFDGSKQQIIKLDAKIDLRKANPDPTAASGDRKKPDLRKQKPKYEQIVDEIDDAPRQPE